VHPDRMRAELDRGYAQATDLAEYLTVSRHIDYRTAYVVVGNVVREASRAGIPGRSITAAMVEEAAFAQTRTHWGVTDEEIAHVLSAQGVVATRTATGGAAPEAFAAAAATSGAQVDDLGRRVAERLEHFDTAENELLRRARAVVAGATDIDEEKA